MGKKIALAALGYIIITFALGYSWHLILFPRVYEAFGVYTRKQPIIPIGLASMIIQGIILAILFSGWKGNSRSIKFLDAIVFNLAVGLFFVSGTVLALAAKVEISNIGAWFGYNLAFSFLQFLFSGIIFGLVFRNSLE